MVNSLEDRLLWMQVVAIACVLLSFPMAASARLGEKQEQIEQRLGKPLNEISNLYDMPDICACQYERNGIRVEVTYVQGISYSEEYWHQQPERPLSEEEYNVLLESNRLGRRWLTTARYVEIEQGAPAGTLPPDQEPSWVLSKQDGIEGPYATANSRAKDNRFEITAMALMEYVKASKKQKEQQAAQQKLKSF